MGLDANWTWQRVGEDEWEFGEVVRGMIRKPVAEVYFDEEKDPRWIWFTQLPGRQHHNSPRGSAHSLRQAVYEAEEALGALP